jgi:hypothetical protein
MDRLSIINYKGKEILYFNHQGLSGNDLLQGCKNANEFIKNYQKDNTLTLANFTDTVASQELMDYLKSEESKNIEKKVVKAAVVGISGIKKILLNAFNAVMGGKYKAFETEEEAKEYLVK